MRSALAYASIALGLSAAVACAASDDGAPPPTNDPGPSVVTEAGTTDGQPDDVVTPNVPTCSSAGWCLTTLPDSDLTLKDIRPFETRAFAIAQSPTLGVKILEWDEAAHKWSYIDDNSQNTFELDAYAGKLWAPNENELYFAVAPAFIYHGKRAAPASPWSWERSELEDHSADGRPDRDHGRVQYLNWRELPLESIALGVWGTSADDVYAWYSNTIFHWKSADGGAPEWVPEYIAEDSENPEDSFFIFAAGGSSSEDVWFAGGRGRYDDWSIFRCPMVIHKAAGSYDRVVDSAINPSDEETHYFYSCLEKRDVLGFSWHNGKDTLHYPHGGWLTSIDSAGAGRAVGILGEDMLAFVEAGGGGAGIARANRVAAQVPRARLPALVDSVSVNGNDTWISGWGVVLHAPTDPARWSTGYGLFTTDDAKQLGIDAATYAFSPTAINGAPLDKPLYQVRGTSNTNLWAIGLHYALHKTTP